MVERAVKLHVGLRPEPAQQDELLVQPAAAGGCVLTERFVLDGVPAQPDTQLEAPVAERAQLRGLLRDQPVVQADVGLAEAVLRSGRALLTETVREIWADVSATGTISLDVDFAVQDVDGTDEASVKWVVVSSSLDDETADSTAFVSIGAGYTAARVRCNSYTDTAEVTVYATQPEIPA